ncbi:hypothetical protein ACO2I3_05870 [Leptospira interrogans]
MFMLNINRSINWLAALFDEHEPETAHRSRDLILLMLASVGLATVVVTLTTLTALGLDALLQSSPV